MSIEVVRTVEDLRALVGAWREAGQRVGLVPTMGALHRGHLSLIDKAAESAGRIVVSIFVNPQQFAPHEDFDTYPRGEQQDLETLAPTPAAAVYAPSSAAMYPEGFDTTVSVGSVAFGLESDARPHFFAGVATVVSKLLIQCAPDCAVFGEKDYQQLQVIKRMAADLDLPTTIIGAPTLREEDGLAMSSRNAYLSPPERKTAALLNKVLFETADRLTASAHENHKTLLADAAARLLEGGFDKVDYVELRDAASLQATELTRPGRLLAAAHIGKTRLIDNVAVQAK